MSQNCERCAAFDAEVTRLRRELESVTKQRTAAAARGVARAALNAVESERPYSARSAR